MRTFTVTARRMKNGRWALSNEELGAYSQVSRLDQAPEEMREALAYLAHIPESQVQIDVAPRLGEHEQIALENLKTARITEEQAIKQSRAASVGTVKLLRQRGYSLRDIGTLLGVSHQRIAQLAKTS